MGPMDGGLTLTLSITIVSLLLVGNAIFVAAEFAILRSSTSVVESDDFNAHLGAKSARRVLLNLERCLLATKLATVATSIVLGWFGLQMVIDILKPSLLMISAPELASLTHAVSLVIAVVLLLSLHMLLGELFAKALACRYPEVVLRILAVPILIFTTLFRPLIFILGGLSGVLLRLVGFTDPPKLERAPTSDELARLVSRSGELGVLDKDEELLLRSVFQFGGTVAREVMTPRTDLVTIHISDAYAEVISIVEESGLSRIPVRGDGVDDILGVVLAKDLLKYAGTNGKSRDDFRVEAVMREPFFIPGTKPIDDLLTEFKRRKIHIAIVLDEHGGVDGLVTLEDLLEELVGDIFDESDDASADVIVGENGCLIVDGGVLVSDLNAEHKLGLPEGDYDTIAGFIFTYLGRLPNVGDQIVLGPLEADAVGGDNGLAADFDGTIKEPRVLIRVAAVSGHRVERLEVEIPSENRARETASSSGASNEKAELTLAKKVG